RRQGVPCDRARRSDDLYKRQFMAESGRSKSEDHWIPFPVQQEEAAPNTVHAVARAALDPNPLDGGLDQFIGDQIAHQRVIMKIPGRRVAKNLRGRLGFVRPAIDDLLKVNAFDRLNL